MFGTGRCGTIQKVSSSANGCLARLTNSAGRVIPTRYVGEQHVKEDLGWIPSLKDWLEHV